MGIFDFMKKRDPLDDLQLPAEPSHELPPTSDPMSTPFSAQQNFTPAFQQPQQNFQPSFSQPSYAPQQNFSQPSYSSEQTSKHDELIASKLDVIKALIENLNQRITILEQKIDMESERKKRSW